jgi:uncharacterized protein YceK
MNNKKGFISVVISAAFLSGCASIVSHSSYPVAIKSAPDNADFTIINRKGETVHSGTTPATVTLKSGAGYFSGETYTVKYSKPGYDDTTAVIDSSLNGWYWGNFIFGGVLGMFVIDPATGAMWSLPDNLQVNLSESH